MCCLTRPFHLPGLSRLNCTWKSWGMLCSHISCTRPTISCARLTNVVRTTYYLVQCGPLHSYDCILVWTTIVQLCTWGHAVHLHAWPISIRLNLKSTAMRHSHFSCARLMDLVHTTYYLTQTTCYLVRMTYYIVRTRCEFLCSCVPTVAS